jgi:2-polyprenyl-3-methyl-5-hydroxy-6-metoxy-1,4-benzoquinol methylase
MTFPPQSALGRIVTAVETLWPEHGKFMQRSFAERTPAVTALSLQIAELIERIAADDLARLVRGYRWMCEMFLAEELEFRRTGRYRYASFADTNREVYQDHDLMARYMDGLLLSQVLFSNHAIVLEFYRTFLAGNRHGYQHLEIGPGHGLLMYYGAVDPRCGGVTAWDVSPTSLDHTRRCLQSLRIERPVELAVRDIIAAPGQGEFDSVVFSEVLEHLEAPKEALRAIGSVLAPEGRLFVNVPINSPAIDHIYLLRSPEEAFELVKSAGLEILDACIAPGSGNTEEKARRRGTVISCAMVARRG